MKIPKVSLRRVDPGTAGHGEAFEARLASLTAELGAKKLGCQLTVVPPGKRAWPRHAHLANGELVYVLEGKGTVRYGDTEFPVEAGDVVSFVPGPDTAHKIVNTASTELRYLCVSTMQEPDVVLYPESGKYAVVAGSVPGGDESARTFSVAARLADRRPNWEGENGDS
jgi:uncharacterized cupin superfamily protein